MATPAEVAVPVVVRPTGYWRPDPRQIVRIGSEVADVPMQLVCSRRHIPQVLFTRRAIVFAAVDYGLSYGETGDALGISQQAVSKIARSSPRPDEEPLLRVIRERLELEASCSSWVRPIRPVSFR